MKKTMLCALATIALFANCTRDGQPEEKKNNADTESADLIIKDIYYAGDFVETPYGNKSEETDDKFISVYNPTCLLYTSPSPRDGLLSRMPSSA